MQVRFLNFRGAQPQGFFRENRRRRVGQVFQAGPSAGGAAGIDHAILGPLRRHIFRAGQGLDINFQFIPFAAGHRNKAEIKGDFWGIRVKNVHIGVFFSIGQTVGLGVTVYKKQNTNTALPDSAGAFQKIGHPHFAAFIVQETSPGILLPFFSRTDA